MEPAASQPFCPRCGYDLGGVVNAWTSACPLEATCSECGLTFDCANILSPKVLGPPWSLEHTRRENVRRWFRTSWIANRPTKLVADLRVDHLVRLDRLIWFGFSWLTLIHLATAFAAMMFIGISPLFTPWGRRGVWQLGADEINEMIFSLVFPYSAEFYAPSAFGGVTHFSWFPIFILTLTPTFLMPLWMTILGTTFREARVRRVHLVRGLVYTLPPAALCSGLLIAMLIGCMSWLALPPQAAMVLGLGLTAAYPVYHARWWYLFISRYLQLRHALATALLMQFMSILVILILGAVLAARNPF